MNNENEHTQSILFRVHNSSTIYSVPIQCVLRVESSAVKILPVSRSPDYLVGICRLCEKNISIVNLGQLLGLEQISNWQAKDQCLLIIKNAPVGFWVEAILGVEILHARQSAGPFSGEFVRNVYFCDERNDLIPELDIPKLLSFCQFPRSS